MNPFLSSSFRFFFTLSVSMIGSIVAQGQSPYLPNFNQVAATELSNTDGNWVRFNPAQPNNIDLVETRIFKMPAKGLGVSKVEFKLVGGDGGTAHFQGGVYNQFADGGQGGEVNYTLHLVNTNSYGRPFIVTFGKKGESTKFHSGAYCSAGGGGASGMSWLDPGMYYPNLNVRWGYDWDGRMIAGAGGGSGGFASMFHIAHGKSANRDASSINTIIFELDASKHTVVNSTLSDKESLRIMAGGSSANLLDDDIARCCSTDDKMRQASSTVYRVMNHQTSGAVLLGTNYGQQGGRPIVLYPEQDATPLTNNAGLMGLSYFRVIKDGGRGGSGMTGGGAGASTTELFNLEAITSTGHLLPTSGAGGTGSTARVSYPAKNYAAADDGYNDYSRFLDDVNISTRTSTNSPQSGYFMYRTVKDTDPPVINLTNATINLGNGKPYPSYSSHTPLNMAMFAPYIGRPDGISDNDLIKSVTFSKTELTCSDIGLEVPVNITVTDFAGNTTNGTILITVTDSLAPVVTLEQSPDIFDVDLPRRINVSSGTYTLTAGNFPQAFDGCQSNTVELHFPPTTFDCSHAGTEQSVVFYYTDNDGNRSPDYTKTFIIVNPAQSTLYVDATATGANNGSSWADAFTNLQDALRFNCSLTGYNIYVANGTYYPDRGVGFTPGDRNATFTLRKNDKLYGGFPAGGGVWESRNPGASSTVLSGEIGNTGITTDNSYHVVTINAVDIELDGFTIRNGRADADGQSGGGALLINQSSGQNMYSAIVRNCRIENNTGILGGAVHIKNQNSSRNNSIRFIGCVFQNNEATGQGGAVFMTNVTANSNQEFVNCLFAQNKGDRGGAIFTDTPSKAVITNCTFSQNQAADTGGGLHTAGTTQVRNSIFYANTGVNGHGAIRNTGTLNATYSNIQGSGGSSSWNNAIGTDQGNNLDVDPRFIAGSLELNPLSLCRNAGQKSFNKEAVDLNGKIRVQQDTIDIGAYECNPIVYVAWDAPDGGDGQSWATAYNNLNEGLNDALYGPFLQDVWVKRGTYHPDRDEAGTSNGRFNTFYIRNAIAVYGGFVGNETALSQRNVPGNPTILSGDLGVPNDKSDNSYHVVRLDAAGARLNGLIVEEGQADHPSAFAYRSGGGIYNSGSLASYYGSLHPVVENCVLRNNYAAGNGGAAAITVTRYNYTIDFVQCVFYNNNATRGGAVYVQKGGNDAADASMRLYNCTGVDNRSNAFNAPGFGEAYVVLSAGGTATLELYNCLLLNNTTHDGSVINMSEFTGSNNYIGTNNGDLKSISDPLGPDGLLMTEDDGLRPQLSSAAINYGDNSLLDSLITTDITGQPRVLQGKIDAGAYEILGCLGLTKLYVDAGIGNLAENGGSWQTAFNNPVEALNVLRVCPTVDTIFIAKGTYYPGNTDLVIGREASFEVWNPVKILGGYPSGGGARDVVANPVVFDGNINSETKTDNAYHIMRVGAGTSDTTLIDGITFKNGYASGTGVVSKNGKSFWRSQGGAISSTQSLVHVNNCRFIINYGLLGGSVKVSGGKFISTHSVYNENTARQNGGTIYSEGDTLVLMGNVFSNNHTTSANSPGGSVAVAGGYSLAFTDISNNIFVRNVFESSSGGAMFVGNGKFSVVNNTLVGNTSTGLGSGIYVQAPSNEDNVLANNIFWNNTGDSDYELSDANTIENNSTGVNPVFTDELNLLGSDGLWFTADDGLKLKNTSPLVNEGSNQYTKGSQDITGADRIKLGTVDVGAYETESRVTRWYVSAAQDSGIEDGSSWATAFRKFEDGLAAAKSGDTLFVAKGTYTPESTGDYFSMKSGVKIYGGFAGAETTLEERGLALGNNSILNGNGNSVIVNTDVNNGALLDGFVIQNGNTTSQGGGVLNTTTFAQFTNLVFVNNKAVDGGAMANVNSQTSLQNAVFYANEATGNGGAIHDNASTTTVLQTTFCQNSAQNGGVLAQKDGSSWTMGNSISWSNTPGEWHSTGTASNAAISYSLLQTANGGTGNIAGVDPKFNYIDYPAGFDGLWFTEDDGLTATAQSRFINTGSNTLSSAISKDIIGAERLQSGSVDMGAYESTLSSYCESIVANGSTTLHVNAGITASGNGFSWSSAFKTLNEALDVANYCTAVETILIAQGNYYPTGYKEADDRTQSFVLSRGDINLSGGFSSYDSTRNVGIYKTILTGNINEDGTTADNTFHVIKINNTSNNIALDGLTISDGKADGSDASEQYGGGIYNLNESGLNLSNSELINNAAVLGGGFYNQSADVTFTNVAITDNTATNQGGGFYSESGSPIFTNTTFANNTASAASSGAIAIADGAARMSNTIVYGGISATYTADYSLIEGNTNTANGNIDATGILLADIFAKPDSAYYALKACSPATNTGTPDVFGMNLPEHDLAGNLRIFADRVDIGAYENTISPDKPGLAQEQDQTIRLQNASGATRYFNSCNELLVAVETTGITNNVQGLTTARVWIDDVQPAQYVKRHYEITPDDNAENAVGKVTLYFTQAEFNAFNVANPSSQLPDGPSGAISNLLVEKRGGSSSDGTGRPHTYPGQPETISDVQVVWDNNLERWEVSFTTTGFSGFFVKTANSPLPVRWISFSAQLNDDQKAALNWKVDETNVSHYEVERSTNARDFGKLGTVYSQNNGVHQYHFTDPGAVEGNVYYRIKLVDTDGTYAYSRILSVTNSEGIQLKAYPNPVKEKVTLEVSPEYVGSQLKLTNLSGVLLQQLTVTEPTFNLSLYKYPAGIYLLYTYDGKVVKLIKE